MEFSQYTYKNTSEILKSFRVSLLHGLSEQEVHSRIKKHGLNEIHAKEILWWHVLRRQFASPFVYLLILAGAIAFILGEYIDSLMIALFVAINAILGFYQEFRSEETLKLLKKYIVSRARVLREGKEKNIESKFVVPGDIIIYEEGDIICSDSRLFESYNFFVDESVLTGESVSVQKDPKELAVEAKEIFQAKNIVFSGTTCVSGKATCVVLATGLNTTLGDISHLAVDTKRKSGFEKGIKQFSSFILRVILLTLVLVFIINIFIKGKDANISQLIVFSIALAVSVIPEALPVVTTFSLSRGARNLAKNKVIVKRLSAIEDLGGIQVLCTDKTGTLTENNLAVEDIHGKDRDEILFYAYIGASSLDTTRKDSNNAFDIAISTALHEKQKEQAKRYYQVQELSFDPIRRRNGAVVLKDSKHTFIVRGAAEEVMKLCSLSEKEIFSFNRRVVEEGTEGKRIIAVAKKDIVYSASTDLVHEEKGMEFLGLISFSDPLKKTAKEAIQKAESLGLKIKILTGDSPEVAGAVAKKIGLISTSSKVLLGEAFEKMSFRKQHEAVEKYVVFSRVSPQQKYKIIQLLQEKYSVGFLGEGINDAPALKIADVGMAVDGASDIARESADIILMKKSLNVIVDGIREGREVFANTLKYIKATLASNFGNFYAVAIASLMIDFLPILPLQILLVNLLSDFPMIAVATDSIDENDIKEPQKYNLREIAFLATVLGLVSTTFDFIFFAIFVRISPQALQTNWFIGSILTELVFLFSIRTKKFFLFSKKPSSIMIALSAIAFVLTIVIPFTYFGQATFKFAQPKAAYIIWTLGIVGAYFFVTESAKLLYYKFNNITKNN